MEAAEMLCAQGFVPQRDIYFAFGHDGYSGGEQGARSVAAILEQRGIRLEMVLDGGFPISKAGIELTQEAALIGVTIKADWNWDLSQGNPEALPVCLPGIPRLVFYPKPLHA
jgi:acetylornithine deacetylase/succinyl-diaminopimelate desuccinylase-like protein